MKPIINAVEVHPQLNHNRHPMDDALMAPGSLRPLRHISVPRHKPT